MADDLDNLIRAAMKTLDEQAPSGYFEALPNRTLARLEGSMQHGSSGTPQTSGRDGRDPVAPAALAAAALEPDTAPVMKAPVHAQAHRAEEREEDSGLHDIRNLAQSTKQRLSKRSITSQPIPDDVLAASSGAFKNIALPQPAKMIALPSVDELPSKAEVAAAEKAAKKATRESKKDIAARESKKEIAAAVESPAAAVVPARQAFTLPSQQRKGSKGPLIALVGLGLAAAAGYVIFMQVQKDESKLSAAGESAPAAKADTAAVAGQGSAAAQAVTAEPIAEPTPAAAPPVEAPKDEAAAGAAQLATDDVKAAEEKATDKEDEGKAAPKGKKNAKPSKGSKTKIEKEEPPKKEETKPTEKVEPKKPVATKGGEGEGEPSFDALLKEAGVSDQQKKDTKPKLDKKSLNRDDFNKGISASAAKAKSCYKGNQGTVMMKLTIAPSGSVSKVTVTGDFAGKPEGSCVESAMKGASFPPWDGGPQSFAYSVLLSD